MKRSAEETARTLIKIYETEFSDAEEGQYRMLWHELRSLTGTSKLSNQLLQEINWHLLRQDYVLVPCDDFIAVLSQSDVSFCRSITSRVLERNLPEEDDEDICCLNDDEYDDENEDEDEDV